MDMMFIPINQYCTNVSFPKKIKFTDFEAKNTDIPAWVYIPWD